MKKTISTVAMAILAAAGCLVGAKDALALPSLQLDIKDGYYDTVTETTVATGNVFTLYAYLIPDANAPLSDFYYASAAVSPKYGPVGGSLGSFVFDGITIDVTTDMQYGTPPIDTAFSGQDHDPGDLSPHGIFDTFFAQFQFKFDANSTRSSYNVQGGAAGSGSMYWQEFVVDVTNLINPYAIHFDLYNTSAIDVLKNGNGIKSTSVVLGTDIDIKSFAPFSHDAESGPSIPEGGGGGGFQPVPEPSTAILLASGIAGLALAFRRFRP